MGESDKICISKGTTYAESIIHWHQWEIQNFSGCIWKQASELESPKFSVNGYEKTIYHLRLMRVLPTAFTIQNGYSLYLWREGKSTGASVQVQLGISDRYESFLFSSSYESKEEYLNGSSHFIPFNFIENFKEEIMINDTLMLACRLLINPGTDSLSSTDNAEEFNSSSFQLSDDLGFLLDDPTTADITLTVGREKLHAHKAILSARSSVFAAALKSNMKKTTKKNITIEDLDVSMLRDILRFIYTDNVPDVESKSFELLEAANKYDLKRLKSMCEKSIYENLNADNAAAILIVACRYNAHQLKKSVVQYIKRNMTTFLNSGGYKQLKKSHAHLIVEVFES